MTSGQIGDVRRIGVDPDAFEAFYREHLGTVRRFVARRVADPHLAADLTADVFVAAIDGASGFRPDRGSPAGWLLGVARNVRAAEFRRQARYQDLVRRIAGRRLLDDDSLAQVEEQIDAERESRQLYAALARLSKRDRALMELVALDGLTMTTPTSLNRFETELLLELRHHVAERAAEQRPARRPVRRRLVAIATSAAMAAALTVGGLALRPEAAAAYSLVQRSNGDIVVTIHDMSDADGLEAVLAEHGVTANVSYDLDMNGIAVVNENGEPAPGTVTALPNPPAAPGCWPVGVDVKPAGDGAVTFTVQDKYIGSDTVLHLHTGGSADSTLGLSITWENPTC